MVTEKAGSIKAVDTATGRTMTVTGAPAVDYGGQGGLGDVAFLEKWPGVPVGNEEGEIIAEAIGDKKAILLSHHGQLIAGATIEEACVLAMLIERAAKMQLLAMAAGEIKLIPENLAREAHDWISKPKRHSAAFDYYSRRVLGRHNDCLL